MTEDNLENVIQQGIDAWHQLKKSWEHWRMVGKALLVGREWAMHHAATNRPEGKGYNLAFGAWLEKYKLNDIDQGDRKRLFEVMDNLVEIEGWRAGLTEGEQRKLNHPSTVLRKWKKATTVPSEETPKKATLSDSVRELDTRVYDLTEEKKELAASYEQLKSENDSLRADVAAKETYIRQLESLVADLKKEMEELTHTLREVADPLKDIWKQVTDPKVRAQRLVSALAMTTEDIGEEDIREVAKALLLSLPEPIDLDETITELAKLKYRSIPMSDYNKLDRECKELRQLLTKACESLSPNERINIFGMEHPIPPPPSKS